MSARLEAAFRIRDQASGTLGRIAAMAQTTDKRLGSLNRRLDDHDRRMGRLGRSARSADREWGKFSQTMAKFAIVMTGLGKIMAGLRLPAMIAAVRMAIPLVAALAGGVAALLPKLTDLAGVAGALPATLTGLGLAMVTVKLATKDLDKALSGNKEALKALTPEARRFVETLKAAQPVVESLRKSAQQGLFPGLERAIGRLAAAAPAVRNLVRDMGKALGSLADQGSRRVTTPDFLRDLNIIGRQGIYIVTRMGKGLLNLLDAARHFAVAARPFTRWLTDTVYGWTEWVKGAAAAGRESGRLETYFRRTRKTLTEFGSILKSAWIILREIGKAARPLGDDLWGSADKAMKGWARFMRSLQAQTGMRVWFASTRDTLTQIFGLAGDIGRVLGRMSGQGGSADLVRSLRTLVPYVEQIADGFARTFGPPMIALLQEFARAFSFYTNQTMFPVANLLGVLAELLKTVNDLMERFPLLGRAIAGVFSAYAVYKLASGLGMVRALAAAWGMVTASAGRAAAAQAVAAGAGMAGGGRGGGVGGAVSTVAGMMGTRGVPGLGNAGRAAAGARAAGAAAGAARLGGLMRFGGLARGALGAAGRFAWPIAAAAAGYGAFTAQREGGFGEQFARTAYGALSGLSMGLAPHWETSAERETRMADSQFAPMMGNYFQENVPTGRTAVALPSSVSLGGIGNLAIGPGGTSTGTTYTPQTRMGARGYEAQAAGVMQGPANRNRLGIAIRSLESARVLYERIASSESSAAGAAAERLKYVRETLAALRDQDKLLRNQERGDRARRRRRIGDRVMRGLTAQMAEDEKAAGGGARGRLAAARGLTASMADALENVPASERTRLAKAGMKVAASLTKGLKRGSPAYLDAQQAAKDLRTVISGNMSRLGQKLDSTNKEIVRDGKRQWRTWKQRILEESAAAAAGLDNNLKGVRAKAMKALTDMGYSKGQADTIMRGAAAGRDLQSPIDAGNAMNGLAAPTKRARGGRIPGSGLRDTVQVNAQTVAAPGEMIVNRHTEARIDRKLAHFGTSLNREVTREGKPHSYRATGGRAAGDSGSYLYPLGARGSLIGTPHSGTHTLGNWQSDNAVDIGVPVGTPVVAVAPGSVGPNFGSLGKGGRFAGLRMTLNTAGNAFYYAHLSRFAPGVQPGASLSAGQVIGYSGSANGVPHLHFGQMVGNPLGLVGGGQVVAGSMGGAMGAIGAPQMAGGGAIGAMANLGAKAYAGALRLAINEQIARTMMPDAGGFPAEPSAASMGGGGSTLTATTFGGPSDPGTGSIGYRGDNLTGQMAFAELGYGTGGMRMGDLPYRTPMRLSYGGRSVVARKLDIGAGAPGASIDLWWETARALGFPEPGKGPIQVSPAALGGRVPFGGWYGDGGDFVATRPTLIGVGDGGAERVTVTPAGGGGGGRGGVVFNAPLVGSIKVTASHPGATGAAIRREVEDALRQVAAEIASNADDFGVVG